MKRFHHAAAVVLAAMAATNPALAQAMPVTMALDWTPNTNHIGLYVAAAKGLYEEAGLEVEILPYSDTSAATLVANRVADFGVIGSIGLFIQRAAGTDLVATYALVQTETGRLVFDGARDDIKSPKDLDGKVYAGFGGGWEDVLLGTMIRHDGGKGIYETVTLGTSAYEALYNGSVDFTLEVYTWEGVKAELDGREQGSFRYADFGVPDQHTNFIGSTEAYLTENPEAAAAFTAATQRGYAFAVEHPDEAADILVAANPDAALDRDFVRASLQTLIEGNYLRSEAGEVGIIQAEKMEAVGAFIFQSGILKGPDGAALTEAPDIAGSYTNAFLLN